MRNRWRDSLPLPDFARPAVYQPVFELPPQAAASQALEVENTPPIYYPMAARLPAPGTGFEVLFGCPQEDLVTVSAPAPETVVFQQTVAPLAM
jgi:hypothetical protein